MKSRERPVMVVHGPEIFDTGYVYRLNNAIRPERIIVAGVMARTAAEESGIPVEDREFPRQEPSGTSKAASFLQTAGKRRSRGGFSGKSLRAGSGAGGSSRSNAPIM